MKKIILTIFAVLSLSFFAAPLLQPAFADCPNPDTAQTPKDQVLSSLGTTGGDCNGQGVSNLLNTVVSILSYIVGVAAIIVLILSGMKYITSGGDSGKVASAKNTLIYALIGIAIAALAQFLVHFVFTAAASNSCSSGHHLSADGQTCVKN
jgi:hypothetical protein